MTNLTGSLMNELSSRAAPTTTQATQQPMQQSAVAQSPYAMNAADIAYANQLANYNRQTDTYNSQLQTFNTQSQAYNQATSQNNLAKQMEAYAKATGGVFDSKLYPSVPLPAQPVAPTAPDSRQLQMDSARYPAVYGGFPQPSVGMSENQIIERAYREYLANAQQAAKNDPANYIEERRRIGTGPGFTDAQGRYYSGQDIYGTAKVYKAPTFMTQAQFGAQPGLQQNPYYADASKFASESLALQRQNEAQIKAIYDLAESIYSSKGRNTPTTQTLTAPAPAAASLPATAPSTPPPVQAASTSPQPAQNATKIEQAAPVVKPAPSQAASPPAPVPTASAPPSAPASGPIVSLLSSALQASQSSPPAPAAPPAAAARTAPEVLQQVKSKPHQQQSQQASNLARERLAQLLMSRLASPIRAQRQRVR